MIAQPASSRYTSRLPVAMSSVGLKQYGDDYGSSSDDCGPDDAPNSWADDDAPHEEGPVSAINCCAKKFIFHTLGPAFFLIHNSFLHIWASDLLHIRSNAVQEVLYTICTEIMRVWRLVPQFLQFCACELILLLCRPFLYIGAPDLLNIRLNAI